MQEDTLRRKLRISQGRLSVSGRGVVIFSVWAVLKSCLNMTINPDARKPLHELFREADVFTVAVFVFMVLVLVFFAAVRLHIGRSAAREAAGKVKKSHYVLGAWFLWLESAVTVALVLHPDVRKEIDGTGAVLLTELTSLFITSELLISVYRVRKLRKMLGTGE